MLFSAVLVLVSIAIVVALLWKFQVEVEGEDPIRRSGWFLLKPTGKAVVGLVVVGLLAGAWAAIPSTTDEAEVAVAESEVEPVEPKAPKAPKVEAPKAVEAPAEVKCVVESTWTDNGAFESIVVKPSLRLCPLAKSVEGGVVVIYDSTGENEVGRVSQDSPNLEFAIANKLD